MISGLYAKKGRHSIAPENLLRAELIQVLYSLRSERLLMEEIDCSVLFRWFVGMNLDEPVWNPSARAGRVSAKRHGIACPHLLHAVIMRDSLMTSRR